MTNLLQCPLLDGVEAIGKADTDPMLLYPA
jgi:hypothetical protein